MDAWLIDAGRAFAAVSGAAAPGATASSARADLPCRRSLSHFSRLSGCVANSLCVQSNLHVKIAAAGKIAGQSCPEPAICDGEGEPPDRVDSRRSSPMTASSPDSRSKTRFPSRLPSTSAARRRNCKCRDVFATVRPVRAARSSTLCSPWPRLSSSSKTMSVAERLRNLRKAGEHALFGTEA